MRVRYEAVWVSRTGDEELAVEGWRFQLSGNFGHSLSPDGSRLAIGLQSNDGADVCVKELPEGSLTRLILGPADDARPTWSKDGEFIWLQSERSGEQKLYRVRADGADEGTYFPTPNRAAQEFYPSPDGEWMVVRVDGVSGAMNTGRDIVAYRLGGDSTEVPLLVSAYDEFSPRLSPDGRVQISTDGGTHPLWKGDGTEIYHVRRANGTGRAPQDDGGPGG